jgi:hypothetical protein
LGHAVVEHNRLRLGEELQLRTFSEVLMISGLCESGNNLGVPPLGVNSPPGQFSEISP